MTKKLLTKFWLRLCMIVAIMTTALTASAAEEVYSTCLFGADYNSQKIGSYTATWTATNGDFTWTIVNGNNNNNGWAFVKFGRKNNASVGEIVTSAAYSVAITKVAVTIDAITATNVNSIKLYTSADNSAWTEAGSFSKATGTQTVDLASPATSLYYKIEFDCASGSANGLVTVSKVEYYYNTGGAVAPSITAADLSISYDSTEGEIEYTVNNPVTGGTLTAATESDWLTVGEVEDLIPFECAVNEGAEREATVTLTYAYGSESVTKNVTVTQAANPNGPGSEANPYTVAQARAAIDAGTGITGVYATGIVSAIPTAWSTQYNNITFNFVDATGDEDFLQAYRCVSGTGVDASTVAVGDIVVVKGNLKKYNSTYEFDTACELVSLTKPAVAVEAPTFNPEAGTYAEAQSVTLSCVTEGATIYYTTDGTEPTTSSNVYNFGSVIEVSTTTTLKAIAVKGGEVSTVTTATYFICSAASPYTVTQALAFPEYPANGVYVHGIVSTAPTQAPTSSGQLTYYISVDGNATDQLQVYKGKGLDQVAFTAQDDIQVGDIVTIYGNVKIYNGTKEFDTGNYLVSFDRPVVTTPSITVDPATVNAPYTGTTGTINVTYNNVYPNVGVDAEWYTDATCATTTAAPSWIEISYDTENNVTYTIQENDGSEARTAYMKIWSYSAPEVKEYSEVITFSQAAYVVGYATLPFSFDGGRADIEDTDGLTQEGLGTDYKNSPYLKLDGTGDYVLLAFNERPGILTFDIIGNNFSDGTFKVQASVDGTTYSDVATYTELGSKETKTISDLGEDVRYIKWVYTEKVTGNVALGNINLAKYGTVVLNDYTLTVANPANVTITASYGQDVLTNGETAEVTEGTDVTVALTIVSGYDLQSVTVNGTDDGQAVTLSPGTTEGVYTFTMPAFNVTVNATAVEHIEPVTTSYVLVTTITSGKTYVIASGADEGEVQVMAEQRTNNRGAVTATITNGILNVSDEYEFVIESASTEDASGYSIYDPDAKGYLYAANSSKNYLMTQTDNDVNGIWTITIDATTGEASVVAEGSSNRNNMHYNPNNGSPIFSCYAETSSITAPVYFFERIGGATPTVQTVTVTSAGYATMVAEANLEIPAGVEVFAVKISGTTAILNAVTSGIPAGEAVLVRATEGDYDFPYATGSGDRIENNELVPATTDISADGTQFVLAKPAGSPVGFYQATGTIPAGKAYLIYTGAGVKGFTFDDDATAIEMVNGQSSMGNGQPIYNLAGQIVNGKLTKGIYIVNGKKVAVK